MPNDSPNFNEKPVEKHKTMNVDEKCELIYVVSDLKPANVYDRYQSNNVDDRYWPPKVVDKNLSIDVEGEPTDTSVASSIPYVPRWFRVSARFWKSEIRTFQAHMK